MRTLCAHVFLFGEHSAIMIQIDTITFQGVQIENESYLLPVKII